MIAKNISIIKYMVGKNFQSRTSLEKTKTDHEIYIRRRDLEGMRLSK